MKTLLILLISISCFSFCPSTEKVSTNTSINRNTSNGYYISVLDLTDRKYHKYILETKDSVNIIFNHYFNSEMELGDIDYPISIYNGKSDFYVARVNIFLKPNGKKNFKHLNYPNVYVKNSKSNKRSKVPTTVF
jgi:hypothetical protein